VPIKDLQDKRCFITGGASGMGPIHVIETEAPYAMAMRILNSRVFRL